MQARLVLLSVTTVAALAAGGVFWASADSRRHSAPVPEALSQGLGRFAGIRAVPVSTPASTPTPSSTPPAAHTTAPHPKPQTATAAAPPAPASRPTAAYSPTSSARQPSPRPPAPAPGPTASDVDEAVFNLLNSERVQNHLPPLQWSSSLACAATEHSSWMDRSSTLSHESSGEPGFASRINGCGFHGATSGENIGVSYDPSAQGALALHTYMYTEPHPPADNETGHRTNILWPRFTYVGVSVIIDQKTGSVWLTEDFGG
jgi:uncharacterized protein YkwD